MYHLVIQSFALAITFKLKAWTFIIVKLFYPLYTIISFLQATKK